MSDPTPWRVPCSVRRPGLLQPARWRRLLAWLRLTVAVCGLQACAVALPQPARTESHALPPPADSQLMQLAQATTMPAVQSGFWPLPRGAHALYARLVMIRQATRSLDLQYYLLADDSVGRTVLRELRDAAQRGVRVRLLLDDLYTLDIETELDTLLGLQQHRDRRRHRQPRTGPDDDRGLSRRHV